MKAIIGLGNPGEKYARTRHNIGFMAVDALAQYLSRSFNRTECKGVVATGEFQGTPFILLKPQTYMNLSGESVRALLHTYPVEVDDLLVVYDDLDLPFGKTKLRMKGSAGGHNGMKSIIEHVGTQDFKRFRLGISRPESGDIISHVLGQFTISEEEALSSLLQKTTEAILDFMLEEDFSKVMNKYNR